MDVSFPLNEGREGGDAVPYEVVSLTQDVKVKLSHIWTKTDHLYL